MPSQLWTFVKLAGDAGNRCHQQLVAWQQQRLTTDSREWSPEQWPAETRCAIDHWCDRVRQHACDLPVVYFCEYVDLWSSGLLEQVLSTHLFSYVHADRYEVYGFNLPLELEVRRQLRKFHRRKQFPEDQWFVSTLLRAANAWRSVLDGGLLLVLRQVTGSLVEDSEISNCRSQVPPWLIVGNE